MAWLYVEYWLTVPDLEDVKITNEPQIENIFPCWKLLVHLLFITDLIYESAKTRLLD